MTRKSTKLEFLQRVIASTRTGPNGPSPLMTGDDYARDHVLIACEAIQFGLTRLYRDREGYGYELRITRAGRLLAAGKIEEAAAAIDGSAALTRLPGEPPDGILATRLSPGGPGISLYRIAARQFAPEMMRGVATGHLVVIDGVITVADETTSAVSALKRAAKAGLGASAPDADPSSTLPSSRAARHLATRKP